MWWMWPKLVPSWMGLLRCSPAGLIGATRDRSPHYHLCISSPSSALFFSNMVDFCERVCPTTKRLWVSLGTWWFDCIRFFIHVAIHISQYLSLQPWHFTATLQRTLGAPNAKNACSTRAFLCNSCASAWLWPNASLCELTTKHFDLFASNVCIILFTIATCNGGNSSLVVIWF